MLATSNAPHAFHMQTESEQRKLLTMTLKKSRLAKTATCAQRCSKPFELPRHSSQEYTNKSTGTAEVKYFEIWLPILDAFRTLAA
jgi:hypothetical protein